MVIYLSLSHDILSFAIFEVFELQQLGSIVPSNLLLIRLVHRNIIEPITRIPKRLEWIVNRKQDTICSNLTKTELQGRSRKVATGGNPQIFLKILTDCFLAR